MSFHWGYGKNDGPHVWGEHWPVGRNPKYGQSPINIETNKATLKTDWPNPQFKYLPERSKLIKNNGHTCQVDIEGPKISDSDDWSFKGGPIHHKYSLAQFHFHWGPDDNSGSEHTVDGKNYALECHLVHFNRDLFKDAGEAIDKPGGIAVCGMLFKPGRHHDGLQKLIDFFDRIQYSGDSVNLPDGFDPSLLLPKTGDRNRFWHYYGSLTTPPLHESVNWTVFHEPQEASPEQLAQFRKLRSHTKDGKPDEEFGGCILKNYRPPQDRDFITRDKNGSAKRVSRQLFTTAK